MIYVRVEDPKVVAPRLILFSNVLLARISGRSHREAMHP